MIRKHIPKRLRPLTHGYAAWGIYATIAVNVLKDNWSLVADMTPWWAPVVLLVAVLGLRLVKQDSVSGDDDE